MAYMCLGTGSASCRRRSSRTGSCTLRNSGGWGPDRRLREHRRGQGGAGTFRRAADGDGLRASASLVLAGLAASGPPRCSGSTTRPGYESLENKLSPWARTSPACGSRRDGGCAGSDRAPPRTGRRWPGGKPGGDGLRQGRGGGRGDRAGPGAGRRAVSEFTRRFDRFDPGRKGFVVHRGRSTPRGRRVPPRSGFPSKGGRRIETFHRNQLDDGFTASIPGAVLARGSSPSPARVYIPGERRRTRHPADERPPARVAGSRGGGRMLRSRRAVPDVVLAAARIAGVSASTGRRAQAIAALAFGHGPSPASR